MIPTELVATAQVPGGGELRCLRHGEDYRIFIDRTELMSTRMLGSEAALAELALERFGVERARRVLVGGLGMGFTLARVLELVGPETTVEVAELVPEIVTWNRELFGHCAGHPLRDPRTRLTIGDVGEVLAAAPAAYEVVLLDVDNGPEGLVRRDNSALYEQRGLAVARAALRPGGVLAVWSSAEHPAFEQRLRGGFEVRRHRLRARRTKGPWRTIWVATAARPR
ncbi:MAG: spermidine synthase [Planctomycetes bacterium]|nr:spermidine synthase [Planctomycetota bacterium]